MLALQMDHQKRTRNRNTTNKFTKAQENKWDRKSWKEFRRLNLHQMKIIVNAKRNTEIDINGDDIHKL